MWWSIASHGILRDFMGLMGFYGGLMGSNGGLMGFYDGLMGSINMFYPKKTPAF